jgi:hypothetical protein
MRRLLAMIIAASATVAAAPNARPADYTDPAFCSSWIAAYGDGSLTAEQHRSCVLAIASTYVDGEANVIPPADILLDPEVSRYALGTRPDHRAGGAEALRATYPTDVTAIDDRQWTIDGTEAFVAYHAHTAGAEFFQAARVTVRNGLIWEILVPARAAPSSGGGIPSSPVVAVVGPGPSGDHSEPDYDDPIFCSAWIGEHGDDSLPADAHRRCMIAIATTYVDAEDNSGPQSRALYDPRVSRYSMGGRPKHDPGNSDSIRTTNGVTSTVIREAANRQWTVEGNDAWIVYDGYLQTSIVHPGFYVAERIRIQRGLIWEIMIAPVKIDPLPV